MPASPTLHLGKEMDEVSGILLSENDTSSGTKQF
jgi:hypothetical protein